MKKVLLALVLVSTSGIVLGYTDDQYAKDMAERYARRDPIVVAHYERMAAIREARLAAEAESLAAKTATKADSTSNATASNAGNNQNVTFTSPADTTVRAAPSMATPALTSTGDTCMGSTSGGVSGLGFGISLGSTWTDSNCKLLKNAREMWNMGLHKAAFAMMCKDPDNRDALESSGLKCPMVKDMGK